MLSQKKLASYSGSTDSSLKLEDWICDVKVTISIMSCSLSESDKVDFVFQHLTGSAREEVKFRFQAFIERKWREGENIQDFLPALLDQVDRASQKSPHLATHS